MRGSPPQTCTSPLQSLLLLPLIGKYDGVLTPHCGRCTRGWGSERPLAGQWQGVTTLYGALGSKVGSEARARASRVGAGRQKGTASEQGSSGKIEGSKEKRERRAASAAAEWSRGVTCRWQQPLTRPSFSFSSSVGRKGWGGREGGREGEQEWTAGTRTRSCVTGRQRAQSSTA